MLPMLVCVRDEIQVNPGMRSAGTGGLGCREFPSAPPSPSRTAVSGSARKNMRSETTGGSARRHAASMDPPSFRSADVPTRRVRERPRRGFSSVLVYERRKITKAHKDLVIRVMSPWAATVPGERPCGMPTSTPLTLSRAARAELESLARSHRGRADEARRARIILLLTDGHSYSTICERVDCTPQTIATWKARYEADGIAGLRGRHRGSKARVLTPQVEARI